MKLALEHVQAINKRLSNGQTKTYYYHRITQRRIKGEPGTLAFFASYEAAGKPDEDANGDTFKRIIEAYLQSGSFQRLAPLSQREYRRNIKIIEDAFAETPIEALSDKRIKGDIIEWHGKIAANSKRNADYALNVLKAITRFAVDANMIEVSYAHGVKNVYRADRSEKIWTAEQVAKVLEAARPRLKEMIIFALNTGQRAGDLRELRWDKSYKNGKFSILQSKSKRITSAPRLVSFPATPALQTLIAKLPRYDDCEFMLTTARGKQWQRFYLVNEFSEAKGKAGIADLHFHDFRGTAVTVLWEAGSNEAEIASITGHSLESVSSILERYTSRTAKMSASAMQRLGDSWIGSLSTV
jgi:integrase